MVARVSALTRMPRASFPESGAEYGACAESSLRMIVTRLLTVSTRTLSPVAGSLRPVLASSVSRFTVRTGAALKGPTTSA